MNARAYPICLGVYFLLLGSQCTTEAQAPPLCGGAVERCVVPGVSSAAQCDETGHCVGSDELCVNDRDCFYPIENGDELPTWNRPQGGLGTRLNLRIEGFPPTQQFSALQTVILGDLQSPAESNAAEEVVTCDTIACGVSPDTCPCDANAGFSCIQLPNSQAICAEIICNQVNRRFPLEVDPYGALVVPELPVRFQNDFGLDDLHRRQVTLHMSVSTHDDDIEATSVRTTLSVGDFITPSWWEE